MDAELVTICFSHYCEKARWALDRCAVPYRELRYMPVLHFPAVMRRTLPARAGRSDAASTRFSTPLLRTPEGALLTDSCDIVAWADARSGGALNRDESAVALERELGEELGPHARRLVYFHLLPDRSLLLEMAAHNVSAAQSRVFRALSPAVVQVVRRALRVTAEGAARSDEQVRRVADRIAARLADGRPYLCGDRFSAADLTFAALFAPMVLPAEYGAWLPAFERLPTAVQPLVREMREHEAGRFALSLYRDERRAQPEPRAAQPRVAAR